MSTSKLLRIFYNNCPKNVLLGIGTGCQQHFSSTTSLQSTPIKNIAIFGAGVLGSGLAEIGSIAGGNVRIIIRNEEKITPCKNLITAAFKSVAKKKFQDDQKKQDQLIKKYLDKIQFFPSTQREMALSDADIVFEAIIEQLVDKQELFLEADKICPEKTIFISSSSSLELHQVMVHVARKDRVLGMHFFHPVTQMKLTEIVRAPETSDETYEKCSEWAISMGKTPIQCKDTPGFIVNRLIVPYFMDAIRMVERGDASIKDIDTGMHLGGGYPLGPFQTMDYIGLNVVLLVIEGWSKKYPDEPSFRVPELLRKLVSEGKFGISTGQGFYSHNNNK